MQVVGALDHRLRQRYVEVERLAGQPHCIAPTTRSVDGQRSGVRGGDRHVDRIAGRIDLGIRHQCHVRLGRVKVQRVEMRAPVGGEVIDAVKELGVTGKGNGYDEWRVEFGNYLRLISRLADETDIDKINAELDSFIKTVRGAEEEAAEKINELLRSSKITPTRGVSLLNDLSAHHEISDALVKAAIIIFSVTRTSGYLEGLDDAAIEQIEKLHAEITLPPSGGG